MEMKTKAKIIVEGIIIMALAILPCLSLAGSLEPTDPPGPTMHTLEELYNQPIWKMFDKVFVDWPDNPRFAVCDNGSTDTTWDDMVLDKETGLVWMRDLYIREPAQILSNGIAGCEVLGWQMAQGLPGRLGWRLPTLQELQSLIDLSRHDPALPSGHPFVNLRWSDYPYVYYWTSTPSMYRNPDYYPGDVSVVEFKYGQRWFSGKDERHYCWCVRGGQGPDPAYWHWK
jgi:hypothetical protein